MRQIVTNALRRAGYRVLATADPASALMLLREHGPTIDLLLTDVIMPGLNGRELARDAHSSCPICRCCSCPGYADRAFGPEGPAGAGGAFLQKPFTLDALLDKVRGLVSRSGPVTRARIVCLTEETTETLYLLGEGDRVVGVSGYTARPPEARREAERVGVHQRAASTRSRRSQPDLDPRLLRSPGRHRRRAGAARLSRCSPSISGSIAGILQMVRDGRRHRRLCRVARRSWPIALEAGLDAIRASAAALSGAAARVLRGVGRPADLGHRMGRRADRDRRRPTAVSASCAAQALAKDRIVNPRDVAARDPEVVLASWCGKAVRKRTIFEREGWSDVAAVRHAPRLRGEVDLHPAAWTRGADRRRAPDPRAARARRRRHRSIPRCRRRSRSTPTPRS